MKTGIELMRAVAKDIITFNTKRKDYTHKQEMAIFYRIMRKHGIKEGEWSKTGNGRICNNFEWTMCLALFRDTCDGNKMLTTLLGNTPKDLLAYGKQPKSKL